MIIIILFSFTAQGEGSDDSDGLSGGEIAGIVIGAIVGAILLGILCFVLGLVIYFLKGYFCSE